MRKSINFKKPFVFFLSFFDLFSFFLRHANCLIIPISCELLPQRVKRLRSSNRLSSYVSRFLVAQTMTFSFFWLSKDGIHEQDFFPCKSVGSSSTVV